MCMCPKMSYTVTVIPGTGKTSDVLLGIKIILKPVGVITYHLDPPSESFFFCRVSKIDHEQIYPQWRFTMDKRDDLQLDLGMQYPAFGERPNWDSPEKCADAKSACLTLFDGKTNRHEWIVYLLTSMCIHMYILLYIYTL